MRSIPLKGLTGLALAGLLALPALAQQPKLSSLCSTCGIVQSVQAEKREGEGGAMGIVGGAVIGGLLGNQVGGGTGKTLATVGGAVGGGYLGNEAQKKLTSKTVWVTQVKMKDGSIRPFETAAQPAWTSGKVVRVNDQGQLVLLK